jgi:hypothetical protein
MKKFILFSFMFGALSSTLVSCGEPPKKTTESSSSSPVGNLGDDTALYISVSTLWESVTDTADAQVHKTCSISSLAPTGTTITCDAIVPEGQLHYSKVLYAVGTKMSSVCPIVSFYPYYYLRSSASNFNPPGEDATTTVDCSDKDKRKVGKQCWGGAAPQIIDGFPTNTGWYHISAGGLSKTYTLEAENTLRWDSNKDGPKNFLTSNNMPAAARNNNIAGKYSVDPSDATFTKMHDYYVVCEDLWAHPIYSIKLNLWDEDTKGQDGVLDEVEDWQ